jgi:hypothetical protein
MSTSEPTPLRSTIPARLVIAFWAMVTVGRLLFGAIGRWVPARVVYHVLPLLLIVTFLLTAEFPPDRPELGILVFGLAVLSYLVTRGRPVARAHRSMPSGVR